MENPLLLLLLLVIAVGVIRRRRRDAEAERLREEPWRASLEGEADDEPLDEEAIRRAEDEFWEESWELPEDPEDQGIQP
jgi:flagellar biosynthesis/type III secretory pathway M-ring protein FliF/YscJ